MKQRFEVGACPSRWTEVGGIRNGGAENTLGLERSSNVDIGLAALMHEIRGRAASLAMFSGELALAARQHDASWVDRRLERLSRVADEMVRIVEAVRRIEDRSPPEPARVDLSALSTRILSGLVERTPNYARARVRVQSNMHVVGDPGEISIVLENLMGNALKFSAMRHQPEVQVTQTNDSAGTVVQVSDNGLGIAQEDCQRIFQPFTRCHSGVEGSGIGLAMVRHIVERHGGRAWAMGTPGLGTTISFRIPSMSS